tara:strand:- start:325 stop:1608 length:1284 start_codon:yes stop_codon:yes gene_type:complete
MHPLLAIPSRALTRFYVIGAILLFLLIVHDMMLLKGFEGVVEAGLQGLLWSGLLYNVWLSRRGEIQKGAWILWGALTLLIAWRLLHDGGLTAIVALIPMPMIVLSFIPKKRDIITISALTYFLLGGLHLYVTMHGPPNFPAPFYEPHISMLSFSVLIVATLVLTLLCAHINVSAMQDISQGILEMESARRLVDEREREWRLASAQAVAMQQTKSRFLANMSHELRTPLNAILGYSEMLAEEFEEDAQLQAHYDDTQKIRLSAKQLLAMINDILDLSRHEADKMPIKHLTIGVMTLMDEVSLELSERAEFHDTLALPVLHVDPGCEKINLYYDPILLQNLILHWILAKSSFDPLTLTATPLADRPGVRLTLEGAEVEQSEDRHKMDTTDVLYDELHELLVLALCQALELSLEVHAVNCWSLTLEMTPD